MKDVRYAELEIFYCCEIKNFFLTLTNSLTVKNTHISQ